MEPKGRFLNVDLEVRSREDLSALAAEFETKACVLHFGQEAGRNFLTVEREDESSGEGLEATVRDLCHLVEGLSTISRQLWDGAESRVLDAGFDATSGHPLAWFSVSPDLLRRIAVLNACLAFTMYPDGDAAAPPSPPD